MIPRLSLSFMKKSKLLLANYISACTWLKSQTKYIWIRHTLTVNHLPWPWRPIFFAKKSSFTNWNHCGKKIDGCFILSPQQIMVKWKSGCISNIFWCFDLPVVKSHAEAPSNEEMSTSDPLNKATLRSPAKSWSFSVLHGVSPTKLKEAEGIRLI